MLLAQAGVDGVEQGVNGRARVASDAAAGCTQARTRVIQGVCDKGATAAPAAGICGQYAGELSQQAAPMLRHAALGGAAQRVCHARVLQRQRVQPETECGGGKVERQLCCQGLIVVDDRVGAARSIQLPTPIHTPPPFAHLCCSVAAADL